MPDTAVACRCCTDGCRRRYGRWPPWRWWWRSVGDRDGGVLMWLPVTVAVGLILAAWAHWYIDSQGLAGDPAPSSLWIWVGLTGMALAVAVIGWRGSQWWRRSVSLLAVLLCLLSAGVSLNLWVGYFRTVQAAWSELTAGPLPDETDLNTVMAMRGKGAPTHGALVPVTIPDDASGFKHRTELVYLPPAWFAANAPKLPVVMMIAGEFNTPSDWPRTGDAIAPIDNFAAAHNGNAPVFVFVDVGWLVQQRHRVRQRAARQCGRPSDQGRTALSVKHFRRPERQLGRRRLVDGRDVRGGSDGDASGVVQHVRRHRRRHGARMPAPRSRPSPAIYGGDAAKWPIYDPTTVINKHGPYTGVSGWFAISSDAPMQQQGRLRQPQRDRARRAGRRGDAERSDRCRQLAVQAGPGQRHRMRGRRTAGPPRLAAGRRRLHIVAAVAGRPDRHARRPEDSAARRGRGPGPAGAPLQAATH